MRMNMRLLQALFAFLLFLTPIYAAEERHFAPSSMRRDENGRVSREDVVNQMSRRKEQFERLITETKKKLADHEAGANVLDDEEVERLNRRMELMQRKIASLGDMSEESILRMQKREEARWERRKMRSREL